jgi:hypothetical protein
MLGVTVARAKQRTDCADGQNSCTGAEGMALLFCSIAFAIATGITALHICGRPTYKTRISTKGRL